jgi:hypothetical protein
MKLTLEGLFTALRAMPFADQLTLIHIHIQDDPNFHASVMADPRFTSWLSANKDNLQEWKIAHPRSGPAGR